MKYTLNPNIFCGALSHSTHLRAMIPLTGMITISLGVCGCVSPPSTTQDTSAQGVPAQGVPASKKTIPLDDNAPLQAAEGADPASEPRGRGAGGAVADGPSYPRIEGNPTLKNLHLAAVEGTNDINLPMPLIQKGIAYRYADGSLSLYDKKSDAVFWKGPIGDASFVLETAAGALTFKDKGGRAVWSKDSNPTPDLTVSKDEGGKATLTDKGRNVLWSGALDTSSVRPITNSQGDASHVEMAGIVIDGAKGLFTVKSSTGTTLWSGPLPTQSTIRIRDKHQTATLTQNRWRVEADSVEQLHFDVEKGTVTINTLGNKPASGKVLATQPIEMLKISRSVQRFDDKGLLPSASPMEYKFPSATLDTKGALLLTFQSSNGEQLRTWFVANYGGSPLPDHK